jgi:hypothetical protein
LHLPLLAERAVPVLAVREELEVVGILILAVVVERLDQLDHLIWAVLVVHQLWAAAEQQVLAAPEETMVVAEVVEAFLEVEEALEHQEL